MRVPVTDEDTASVTDEDTEDSRTAADRGLAVGVVATDANADSVARTLLRAHEYGHDALLVCHGRPDAATIGFARQFDATIVYPSHLAAVEEDARTRPEDEQRPARDEERLRDTLATVAQAYGYPGLIFHRTPEYRIDYRQSVEAWTGQPGFTVDAHVEETDERQQACHVLVAIPAYEEAGTIGEVAERAKPHADEVVVVDDGSSDQTAERAREAGATVVEHGHNRGYGVALKTAFSEAKARETDYLVILDGDGQHDPGDVPKLLDVQKETNAELVIGSRFVGETDSDVPAYRRFGLWVINVLTNLSVGVVRPDFRISDTQSGFRAYDSRAIETLAEDDSLGDRMTASTDILYHAIDHNYAIEEVPTTIRYDVDDGSSHHPIAHGLGLLNNILKTIEQNRPMTVLGIPGFAFAFTGLTTAYWAISSYVRTGAFPVVSATTSTLLVLAGVFACFTAIVLHAFNHQT